MKPSSFTHKKLFGLKKQPFFVKIKINSNQKSLSFNLPEIHLTSKLFGGRWLDSKSLFVFLNFFYENKLVSFSLIKFHFKFFFKRKLIKKEKKKLVGNLQIWTPPAPLSHFSSSKQFSYFSATKK
jgi:hypothetical protein